MLLNQILIISIFSNQSISIKILIQILILINIRCSGHAYISPGCCFWKEAVKRGRFDEIADKLKLDDDEKKVVVTALASAAADTSS